MLNNITRRMVAVLLAICLCASFIPASALAATEQEIPSALQNKEPVTSKRIADYGKDSFLINANGSLVLKDWQADTETLMPIQNAKNIAVTGSTLVVLQNNGRLMMLDIPSKEQTLIVNLDAAADKFAVCDGKVYYSVNKKLYQMNLSTKVVKKLSECGVVEDFYLYDNDVLAYQPPVEKIKIEAKAESESSAYMLLSLKDGKIESQDQHEAEMPQTNILNYADHTVRVGNETMPFPEYPNKSIVPQGNTKPYGYSSSVYGDYYYIHGNPVCVRGWTCYGFAEMAFRRLFGYLSFSGYGTSIRPGSQAYRAVSMQPADEISVNYLKSIFGKSVLPGAHIRTLNPVGTYGEDYENQNLWQHSLCYMDCDDTYIYTYEGNWDGKRGVAVRKRTWSEFNKYLTQIKKGICFIAMPRNYPGVVNKPQTQEPVISQQSYVGGKNIALSGPAGAAIYYTTDGSAPTTESRRYTSPFRITTEGNTKVRAIALQPDHTVSEITETIVSIPKLAAPVISSELTSTGMRITITSDMSNNSIHYTIDGYTPTVNSPVYHDSFVINTNQKIQAISVREGCISSDIAVQEIRMNVPDKPKVSLLDTPEKIPAGNAAKVKWEKTPDATSYVVKLKMNGSVVDTQTTSETLATFMLDTVGQYEITVQAVNFFGSSDESYPPLKVEAMAPCHVTFKDWNGTVLSQVEVSYGGIPIMPKIPNRTGYDFTGWTISQGQPIYKDTIATALYEVKTYTVNFYDIDGITLLDTKRVNYGINATPPDEAFCHTDPGYKFAGWHVKPESKGHSYKPVDGDVDVVAVQAWAEPNLPVHVEIRKAYRMQSGDSYKLEVFPFAKDGQAVKGRIVAVLKTDAGKTVASQIADFQVSEGSAEEDRKQTITINYVGKARHAEVIVVGVDEKGNTGGAYSAAATVQIQSEMDWGHWSDWTETPQTPTATVQVQKKTQVRQRTVETTTSTNSSMSGWIKYDTQAHTGNWSGWSRTKPGDAPGRKIESRYVNPTYKTQYRYRTYRRSYDNWTHFCPGAGEWVHHTPFTKVYTDWRDSPIPAQPFGPQCCSGTLAKCDHTGYLEVNKVYRDGLSYFFEETRQVITSGDYHEYRYQDTSYTYFYYRYRPWSDWSDQGGATPLYVDMDYPTSETELRAQSLPVPSVDTQTRTLYRSRKQVVVGDAEAGTEDTTGQQYHTSGAFTGLKQDYNGHTALVLVYQRTNSDPTAEKLQYVGQTRIGAGNTYDFTFRPKEDPSIQTGDFIVSIALEGASKILNVDVKKAPRPTYTVKFVADGKELLVQQVQRGETAKAPQAPEKKGYTFVGWDDCTTNVHSNLTITANYIPKECVGVNVDFANETVKMTNYLAGDKLGVLPVLKAEGKEFLGWYTYDNGHKKTLTSDTIIEENMLIIADWKPIVYTVRFVDAEDKEISKQLVEHGKAAVVPDFEPSKKDMEFLGWSTDTRWWNVTANITVQPLFSHTKNTEDPLISILPDKDILDDILTFKSSTPGAKIYYDIEYLGNSKNAQTVEYTDALLPEGFTAEYSPDEPIHISEDVRIKLMATAPGSNDSAVVIADVKYSDPNAVTPGEDIIYQLMAEDIQAAPGETVTVPLYITSTEGIGKLSLGLEYDKSALQLVQESSATEQAADSNMTLLRNLKFKVLETAKAGSYPVWIEAYAKDTAGKDMYVESAYLSVEVQRDTGVILSGEIRSYDPGKPIRIELQQKGTVVQIAEIPAAAGTGVAVQRFEMKAAQPGVYDLVIHKDGHLDFTIRNLNVQGSKVELGTHENPAIRQIQLIIGDLDANSIVDKTDLNILWNGKNFNQNTGRADNPLADLNADGIINREDMSILWNEANYNKSVRDCTVHY